MTAKKGTAKKSAKKSSSSEAKTKESVSNASQAKGGASPARGSSDSSKHDAQREADRAQAGATGNEAAIRRARNQEGADKAERAMRGESEPSSAAQTSSAAEKDRQKTAKRLSEEFPGQVLGVSGARASGATDAATDDLSKRSQIVAEHTGGASHGALSVHGDASQGFVDPIPEGARPKGGGSPVLGEHVVGDTEFRGSRGLADRSPGAGKGQKTGNASLAAENLPRGFKPGKSPESEQRDSNYDGNRAAAAAPRGAGERQAKGGTEIKLLFVVTDYRENGPADVNPNSITAILKAAPPGLSKKNAEFFGGVTPSGTVALNAFDTKYDDVFAMGELYEVTIKPQSGAKK